MELNSQVLTLEKQEEVQTQDQRENSTLIDFKMVTHCKDSMSCPIKCYTVNSRQMSENPPVHFYVLIHSSWERCAKSGTPCELFSSMDLH